MTSQRVKDAATVEGYRAWLAAKESAEIVGFSTTLTDSPFSRYLKETTGAEVLMFRYGLIETKSQHEVFFPGEWLTELFLVTHHTMYENQAITAGIALYDLRQLTRARCYTQLESLLCFVERGVQADPFLV